jgi:hypothetical protein
MKNMQKFLASLLVLGMLCIAGSGEVQAQKSGGSKPSFGGDSSSKPFSGSPSAPKFSGGSSSAGSTPKIGGGGSSPPKFSGGSSSPPPASGGTPKFGGGSSGVAKGSPTDKPKFGGGSTSPPAKTVTNTPIQGKTPTSVSKKPVAESFDKLSTTDARKAESRKAYQPAPEPASTYSAPNGKTVSIPKNDKNADYLRGRMDESRWQTRYQRTDVFYGSYYTRYPMGPTFFVYGDYYHPYWNFWLLSQSLDVMSLWVYHHQLSMDQARLNALYAQNAQLKAQVAALERQGIPRDVNYTPRNVETDMMYNDSYVTAVYNPQPKVVDEYEYDDDVVYSHGSGVGHVLVWIFFWIPLMCLGVFCLYWLVFKFRW